MWFLKKKKEVAYYSNFILDLEESEEMHLVLAQSKIDRRSAKNMHSAMKLICQDGPAKEIIPIEEGEIWKTLTEKKKFIFPIRNPKTIII